MPSEDYAAVSTGALKLKGVASSSKVGKHKKKKAKRPQSPDGAKEQPPSEQSTELQLSKTTDSPPEDKDAARTNSDPQPKDHDTEPQRVGKTEAELRHEERRRKRLDERLKREGIKTHKEKVEELNRYLSSLSEHHDMYGFLPPRCRPSIWALLRECVTPRWLADLVVFPLLRRPRIGPG